MRIWWDGSGPAGAECQSPGLCWTSSGGAWSTTRLGCLPCAAPSCPLWGSLALQGETALQPGAQHRVQCILLAWAAAAKMSVLRKTDLLLLCGSGGGHKAGPSCWLPSQESACQSLDIDNLNSSIWGLLFSSTPSFWVCILERLFRSVLYKVLEYLTRSCSYAVNLQSLNWKSSQKLILSGPLISSTLRTSSIVRGYWSALPGGCFLSEVLHKVWEGWLIYPISEFGGKI